MNTFPPSELILRDDGSVYHLALTPEQIAPTIITVGDPERVSMVSKHFDTIEHRVAQREFHTHTGSLNGKPISVLSTGIGTDNIDIVLNELDALVNIDLDRRQEKAEKTRLTIVRIGTSGALQPDIPVDSFVASTHGLGLDGLLPFYVDESGASASDLLEALINGLPDHFFTQLGCTPYLFAGDADLLNTLGEGMTQGITATCAGFYAPQGRQLRLKSVRQDLLSDLSNWRQQGHRLTNFEMETAGIYGLGRLLGHRCLSLSAILANRPNGEFSEKPHEAVKSLIRQTLDRLVS